MHAMKTIHRPLTPAASTSTADTLYSFPVRDPIFKRLAWHFQYALVTFSALFNSMRANLGTPETVFQIPIMKTIQVPCRAMDINQSTNDGQAQILENILAQANLGDPTDTPGVVDIREHVILIHGDLATAERLEGIRASHAIESNPVRRLQYPIFVMGLFHYQMACADAIWRMFIEPKASRNGANSLYQQACSVRPYDSGRIGSKPGFRLMHDLVHQCASARMLDCWRVELARRDATIQSLSDFAAQKPSWDAIVDLLYCLATKYLDSSDAADVEAQNNSLILGRLVRYVELCHAMKHGDIGRVEQSFMHWVFVFKSVGKHKYATHIIKLVNDMHYVYPDRLA